MRKIVATNSLTLDGVMQAPGRPDEDRRGGFEHGGWARAYNDAVMMKAMGEGMAQGADLLFGRRTYEDFFAVWPGRKDNPFTAVLDNSQKYVASRTLREPLPWQNSTLLAGDAAETVARPEGAAGQGHRGAGERRPAADADAARPRGRVRAADPPAGAGAGPPAVQRRRATPRRSVS